MNLEGVARIDPTASRRGYTATPHVMYCYWNHTQAAAYRKLFSNSRVSMYSDDLLDYYLSA